MPPPSRPQAEKSRPGVVELPADTLLMIDAFRTMHFQAPRTNIIQEAVRRMIEQEISADDDVKERYERALAEIRREQLKLVAAKPPVKLRPNTDKD